MPSQPLTEEQAFSKLAALCARGEHCQHDLLEKMRGWQLDEETQARVMARLIKGRYVDDERYAHAFVHDKMTYNQWGPRKIEQALYAKRIDRSLVSAALEEIDKQQFADLLRPLLKHKEKSVKARNDYERYLKLMNWAVGRGFTPDIIRMCINEEPCDL